MMPKLNDLLGDELAEQVAKKIGENKELEIIIKDAEKDPRDMTDTEYIEWREKQIKEAKNG